MKWRLFAQKQGTKELEKETDRTTAILAAAYLDSLLEDFISTLIVVDQIKAAGLLFNRGNGPLGTFSAKMDLIYCLGYLSYDEYRDLNLIRRIRNIFAHNLVGISFDTPEVKNRCREFKGVNKNKQGSSRERFITASVRIMVEIILKSQDKKEGNLKNKELLGDQNVKQQI